MAKVKVAKTIQRVSLGRTEQAIIVSHIDFDADGLMIEQRQGIIPLDPTSDPAKMQDKIVRKEWEMFGVPNQLNGFMQLRQVSQLPDDIDVIESGRSLTVVLFDAENAEEAITSKKEVEQTA